MLENLVGKFIERVDEISNPLPLPDGVAIPEDGPYGPIVRCASCNVRSGTLLVISHKGDCPYWVSQATPIIRYYDPDFGFFTPWSWSGPDVTIGMFEPPRKIESGTIGTFGAGPCIIVGVHNEDTNDTWMVHLDAMTGDEMFCRFINLLLVSSRLSIYLCGGDSSSIKLQAKILRIFDSSELNIVYRLIHINDSDSNQLTIDATTGRYSMAEWDFKSCPVLSLTFDKFSMVKDTMLWLERDAQWENWKQLERDAQLEEMKVLKQLRRDAQLEEMKVLKRLGRRSHTKEMKVRYSMPLYMKRKRQKSRRHH